MSFFHDIHHSHTDHRSVCLIKINKKRVLGRRSLCSKRCYYVLAEWPVACRYRARPPTPAIKTYRPTRHMSQAATFLSCIYAPVRRVRVPFKRQPLFADDRQLRVDLHEIHWMISYFWVEWLINFRETSIKKKWIWLWL